MQTKPGYTSERPYYYGTVDAVRKIFRYEGIRGFYQGLTPSVAGAGVAWAAYFYWYVNLVVCALFSYFH